MEVNELNKNANGGTELMQRRIHSSLDPDLLRHFQIIPSRVRELDEHRKKIYWVHDLPGDNEVQHLKNEGWKKFDKIVFVSHWQQQAYAAQLGVPYSAGHVLKNAIVPIEDHEKSYDKIRLIYHSTPHRGLELLYHVFDHLTKEFDGLELKVFSSFDLYGWPQRDDNHKELFKLLEAHPCIDYSKSVTNEEIRGELQKSHIFAYPSVWPETSCLCLIEAMSAGLTCVHPSLAALPETSLGQTTMYGFTEEIQQHVNRFYSYLKEVIRIYKDEKLLAIHKEHLQNTKFLADEAYNLDDRTHEWTQLLKSLL